MKCPKCEEGNLVRVVLKLTNKKATLCDYCEAFWLEGEEVKGTASHDYHTLGDNEYILEPLEEIDLDNTSPKYTHVK